MICDSNGYPLHFELTAGQVNESTRFDSLLVGVDEQLTNGRGKPVAWPVAIGGDMSYRANWIDEYLLELGIKPVIPTQPHQDPEKRLVDFDREVYRDRNIVERLIGWLKESRRIFSRFEKSAKNFAGMLTLACIRQYLRYDVKLSF